MTNNTIKIRVTTFAMLIDFYDGTRPQWVIDTYPRMNATSDKNFKENYMSDYQGNGILDIKIIESEDMIYDLYSLIDFERIKECLQNDFPKINLTLLTY